MNFSQSKSLRAGGYFLKIHSGKSSLLFRNGLKKDYKQLLRYATTGRKKNSDTREFIHNLNENEYA
ncbi:MAG: hypothetical protein AB2L20_04580 [Mangrovibacterium sp.]